MNREQRRKRKKQIDESYRLVRESRKTREQPKDIPVVPGTENSYYRLSISQAGYTYRGDWSDVLRDQYNLPPGIEVWGKGDVNYLFIPQPESGLYEFGGTARKN